MVDVNAVGAGGGSVAWLDAGGFLKVGPTSAGAKPGPACYGIGGMEPTVTDANLVLGRLSPKGLLAGRVPLDMQLARDAFAEIAQALGISIEHAALGTIDIVVANMVRAIRAISVERGFDPRMFALMAFGGGGPLHAADVARELGTSEVIVPTHPGILCAQGVVVSDLRENLVRTHRTHLDEESVPVILESVDAVLTQAQIWFHHEAVPVRDRVADIVLDLRYVGQNYELSIPIDAAALRDKPPTAIATQLRQHFCDVHEQNYGHQDPRAAIEIINYRCVARARLHRLPDSRPAPTSTRAATPSSTRSVWFDRDAPVMTPVFQRERLQPGHVLAGPAIVEQMDTTTLIRPRSTVTVDASHNLILESKA